METRLGGANRDLKNGSALFKGEVVLIVEQEHSSARRRHAVEESQEGLVG